MWIKVSFSSFFFHFDYFCLAAFVEHPEEQREGTPCGCHLTFYGFPLAGGQCSIDEPCISISRTQCWVWVKRGSIEEARGVEERETVGHPSTGGLPVIFTPVTRQEVIEADDHYKRSMDYGKLSLGDNRQARPGGPLNSERGQ